MYKKLRAYTRNPFITLGLLIVVLITAYGLYARFATSESYSDADPAYNATYWKSQIEAQGSVAAFALFKERNEKAPSERKHFSAHVFGAMLAETKGVEGITACDASFGFGCYHGFFSKIISTGGEAFVQKLDQACVATYGPFGTGCQHGIGHGILEYVGYQRIADALALCKQTTQKVPLLGCTSGVFMEYFSPLLERDGVLVQGTRSFDVNHPLAPCDTVLDEYKESCFFELGHWLYTTQRQSDSARPGVVCAEVPLASRPYCFLGLGDSAGPANRYNIAEATAYCDQFTGDARTYCRAGVSWSMFANPAYRTQASQACQLPAEADTARCKVFADLTLGQANQ